MGKEVNSTESKCNWIRLYYDEGLKSFALQKKRVILLIVVFHFQGANAGTLIHKNADAAWLSTPPLIGSGANSKSKWRNFCYLHLIS